MTRILQTWLSENDIRLDHLGRIVIHDESITAAIHGAMGTPDAGGLPDLPCGFGCGHKNSCGMGC